MDEQEYQQELREKVEYGRKAKIASEVVADFVTNTRNMVRQSLEDRSGSDFDEQDINYKVMYLRVLSNFEKSIQTNIQIGELAEKELNKDAD